MMRLAVILSTFLHSLIIGFGIYSWQTSSSPKMPIVETIDINLVTMADITDLNKGENVEKTDEPTKKNISKTRKSKPSKPKVISKTAPSTAPQVSKKPKISQKATPPPKPSVEKVTRKIASRPLLKPKPKKQVPRKQEPKKVVPKIVKVKPKKQIAKLQKPKKADKIASIIPKSGFDANKISALLNKTNSQANQDEGKPDTGVKSGGEDRPMTQSEKDILMAHLSNCWRPLIGARDAANLRIDLRILLKPDGHLSAPPEVRNSSSSPSFQPAADAAKRAIYECAPFDFLPKDSYASWRSINTYFDPSEMFTE